MLPLPTSATTLTLQNRRFTLFKESVDMPWLQNPAIKMSPADLPTREADDYESDPELIARESKRMLCDLEKSIR